jgi:hypothetical protein
MSHHQNAGQNHNINLTDPLSKKSGKIKIYADNSNKSKLRS